MHKMGQRYKQGQDRPNGCNKSVGSLLANLEIYFRDLELLPLVNTG